MTIERKMLSRKKILLMVMVLCVFSVLGTKETKTCKQREEEEEICSSIGKTLDENFSGFLLADDDAAKIICCKSNDDIHKIVENYDDDEEEDHYEEENYDADRDHDKSCAEWMNSDEEKCENDWIPEKLADITLISEVEVFKKCCIKFSQQEHYTEALGACLDRKDVGDYSSENVTRLDSEMTVQECANECEERSHCKGFTIPSNYNETKTIPWCELWTNAAKGDSWDERFECWLKKNKCSVPNQEFTNYFVKCVVEAPEDLLQVSEGTICKIEPKTNYICNPTTTCNGDTWSEVKCYQKKENDDEYNKNIRLILEYTFEDQITSEKIYESYKVYESIKYLEDKNNSNDDKDSIKNYLNDWETKIGEFLKLMESKDIWEQHKELRWMFPNVRHTIMVNNGSFGTDDNKVYKGSKLHCLDDTGLFKEGTMNEYYTSLKSYELFIKIEWLDKSDDYNIKLISDCFFHDELIDVNQALEIYLKNLKETTTITDKDKISRLNAIKGYWNQKNEKILSTNIVNDQKLKKQIQEINNQLEQLVEKTLLSKDKETDNTKLYRYYEINEIAKDTFSFLYRGKYEDTEVVIKRISIQMIKNKYKDEPEILKYMLNAVEEEIKINRKLNEKSGHENIIKLIDIITDDYGQVDVEEANDVFFIFEAVENDLHDVLNNNNMNPFKIAKILENIIDGVLYMHETYIYHRDLRLENILLGKDDKMKVANFGYSFYATGGTIFNPDMKVGTKEYVSPDTLEQETCDSIKVKDVCESNFLCKWEADKCIESCAKLKNEECAEYTFCYWEDEVCKNTYLDRNLPAADVWSIGVCLYVLFNNSFVDYEDNGQLKLSSIPTTAHTLVSKMLEKDVNKRIQLENVLKDEWFKSCKVINKYLVHNYKVNVDYPEIIKNLQIQGSIQEFYDVYKAIKYLQDEIPARQIPSELLEILNNQIQERIKKEKFWVRWMFLKDEKNTAYLHKNQETKLKQIKKELDKLLSTPLNSPLEEIRKNTNIFYIGAIQNYFNQVYKDSKEPDDFSDIDQKDIEEYRKDIESVEESLDQLNELIDILMYGD